MALEIKELEIRMRVDDGRDAARSQGGAPVQRAGCGDQGGGGGGGQDGADRRAIVDDSVRRVLQALKNMQER